LPGEFLFCEDGIDTDAGGVLRRDPGQQICYKGPRPGPSAETSQGFIIQCYYDGSRVPVRRPLAGYQAVEEPSVKVGEKRGSQKGCGTQYKRKDATGGNDQRFAATKQRSMDFEIQAGHIIILVCEATEVNVPYTS
jgi:hypothetical protein